MEIAGLIISIVAIVFSIISYFIHDIKIKRQEKLLNDYQLNKIEEEKQDSLKADIEANVIKGNTGNRIIKVYNKGKSIAKQVEVLIPDVEGIQIMENPCPINIKPQTGIEITLITTLSRPDKLDISFNWKDDFKENNTDNQTIQI